MTFSWTADRIEKLETLAGEDMSASEIGAVFGVSRNAIIGKLNRMGMKTGHAIYHPPGTTKRQVAKALELKLRKASGKGGIPPLPASEPVELPPDKSPHALPFMKAEEHHCRWPLDQEVSYDMLICGAPKAKGISYCNRHARIAFHNWVR